MNRSKIVTTLRSASAQILTSGRSWILSEKDIFLSASSSTLEFVRAYFRGHRSLDVPYVPFSNLIFDTENKQILPPVYSGLFQGYCPPVASVTCKEIVKYVVPSQIQHWNYSWWSSPSISSFKFVRALVVLLYSLYLTTKLFKHR
jgi:hypothetical protein